MSLEARPWPQFVDEEEVERNVPFRRHSVRSSRNRTWLPTAPEELAAPLHVKPVSPLDLPAVLDMMASSRRARFEQVFNIVKRFTPTKSNQFTPLPQQDGDALLAAGIAEAAEDKSAVGLAHAFSVVEEKSGKLRRRFILDPRELNDWLENEYKADVPLPHVSALLDAAHQEYAACEDFASGFHQVRLPQQLRHLFRFRCGNNIMQLTRLPMGLATAPELFHTIASTLAGDPVFCVPAKRAPKKVRIDVWIDNVRFTGPINAVKQAKTDFVQRCTDVSATLNTDPKDRQEGRNYTFCGVRFGPGVVSVSEKTHRRVTTVMPKLRAGHITNAELEALFGRLWFASAVLGISARDFWWTIKSARRRLADVNRGVRSLNEEAQLSTSALAGLVKWTSLVVENNPRSPPKDFQPHASYTLYSDASNAGWGAVLINDETQQVYIAGGRWQDAFDSINTAETRAIALGIESFKDHIVPGVSLLLRIDNTSALAGVKKGRANSHAINAELANIVPRLAGIKYSAEYVASAANLADAPSRGL